MLLKSAQKAGCGGPDVLKNDIICLRRCYAEEEAGVQERAGNVKFPSQSPATRGHAVSTSYVHFISTNCRGSDGKEFACHAGDPGSIPRLGRSPGEGNGNPLQHSCLENPMDGGA